MIKKLFVLNQFILGFILIGLLIFPKIFSYEKSNKFLIRQVTNSYDIYLVNNTYIISDFQGSGGFILGGLMAADKIPDINKLNNEEIKKVIDNNLDYIFPSNGYPDNSLYIGNFDFDKNIEIFT